MRKPLIQKRFLQILRMTSRYRRWNEGRPVGPRRAFEREELLRLIASLRRTGAARDLALLMTGVDSMLRASDLLALRVADVAETSGAVRETLLLRQRKTGSAVAPVLTPATRAALTDWIAASGKRSTDFLFTRPDQPHGRPISATTYRRAVKGWAALIGLDPADYSSHSIRRTKPVFMYRAGCRIADISRLLGHKSTDVTLHYLGITTEHLRLQALRYDVFAEERPAPTCQTEKP